MADAAQKFCSEPGCAGLTIGRFCAAHRKNNIDKRTRPWQHLYNTKAWKLLRKWKLAQDPICEMCHRSGAMIVDHIKDHLGDVRLFFDREDLQSLCKSCHDTKTALTARN